MPTYEVLMGYSAGITVIGLIIIDTLVRSNKTKDETIKELTEIIKLGK